MSAPAYEAVIGLEVHAQLATHSKLFCGCSTEFGASPNAHTCEVCLGMPGVLPVLNRAAVERAVRAAVALRCQVHTTSQWSRKNYFYPDLPKGYQITQYDRPLATGGRLRVHADGTEREVRIARIHMEEDAGKSIHDEAVTGSRTHSMVDFNRGGTALIEIVSEPDLRSAAEAAAYLEELRDILRAIGVCDGNMEQGSLRCDANVSLRPAGTGPLGTRTELKNINSFRFLRAAIEFEIGRQAAVLDAGEAVVQETRLWDSDKRVTRSMRSKEEAHDYRYFPDPDLPDLVLPVGTVERIAAELPELPAVVRERLVRDHRLTAEDAGTVAADAELASYFAAAVELPGGEGLGRGVANLMLNWLLAERNRAAESGAEGPPPALAELLPPRWAVELVALIESDTISRPTAKSVFDRAVAERESPRALVERGGLAQVSDTSTLEPVVREVLAQNPDNVAAYRAGKTKVLGFLVGQVMKASGGKANPKLVNELLRKALEQG